jgi:hypothetical protein
MSNPTRLSFSSKAHAYWLTTDDSDKAKRTKGVTTLAKVLEDNYSITQWLKRNVAAGMGMRPDLVERAAAHYDDRDELDGIAEEALTAAKAHEAAARGTAVHRITERIDLEQMIVDSPIARQVQAAYANALADAGLEVIPDYVERAVVYPDVPLAGTFDRIFRRKLDGALVLGDIKTGARALQYPHAIAIQLALYANAPWLAGKLSDKGVTETFSAMPGVDKRNAYIVAMPGDDLENVQVRPVDIAAGWEAASKLVFPILEWRARTDLVRDQPIATASLTPHTDSIKGRLGILKMVDGARERVARAWPDGVPTKPPWTDDQGAAINRVLTDVELALGVPF